MSQEFKIKHRSIGEQYQPLIIAEIGINHGGNLDEAIKIANAAINAGAEVVKHQTHIVEDEMSEEAKSVIPGNAETSIFEIMQRCTLNEEEEYKLMKFVESKGAIFISTPFSRAAADRLIDFDIPCFKIGSGECNNYPLIRHISKAKKPVILSTGMNSIETIRPSVEILEEADVPFALLHCTNVYPTPPELVRLGGISQLKLEFPQAIVGLSDHTTDNYACFGAVALGASILERHFTDSMKREGEDICCSMDPENLKLLIEGSKIIFKERGGTKGPVDAEKPTIDFAFGSVVAIENIQPGDYLSKKNIWIRRPSGGDFGPSDFENLLGLKVINPIKNGERISKLDILFSNQIKS